MSDYTIGNVYIAKIYETHLYFGIWAHLKILVTTGISLLTDIVAGYCKPSLTQLPTRQTLTLSKIARESK